MVNCGEYSLPQEIFSSAWKVKFFESSVNKEYYMKMMYHEYEYNTYLYCGNDNKVSLSDKIETGREDFYRYTITTRTNECGISHLPINVGADNKYMDVDFDLYKIYFGDDETQKISILEVVK